MSLNEEVNHVCFLLFQGGKGAPAVLLLLVSVLIKCTEESEQHAHPTEPRALYSKDVFMFFYYLDCVFFLTYIKNVLHVFISDACSQKQCWSISMPGLLCR